MVPQDQVSITAGDLPGTPSVLSDPGCGKPHPPHPLPGGQDPAAPRGQAVPWFRGAPAEEEGSSVAPLSA